MASFTGKAAGNWSAVGQTTWNEVGTPAAGDTVDLNGKVIVMDIATIPAGGGSLLSLGSPGTAGQLTLAINTLGNCAINAATITAGTAALIVTAGAAPTKTLTITCTNLYGGSGATSYGVYHGSTAALVVNGNVTGGTGNWSDGIRTSWGPVRITGNVTGSSAGSYGTGFTSSSEAGSSITNGNITAGGGTATPGVWGGLNGIMLNNCNLVNSSTNVAWAATPPIWNITGNANYALWYIGAGPLAAPNTKFGPEPTAAQMLSGVVCGDVTGTLAMTRLVGKGGGLVG